MIAPSSGFWKAFFDPADPKHGNALAELRIFDREKIVLSQFVMAEVVSWLLANGKKKQKDWFLDYAQNTVNTRIFHFGREELSDVLKISAEEDIALEKASLEYLRRSLNCDIA
jgi:hypothetical protein